MASERRARLGAIPVGPGCSVLGRYGEPRDRESRVRRFIFDEACMGLSLLDLPAAAEQDEAAGFFRGKQKGLSMPSDTKSLTAEAHDVVVARVKYEIYPGEIAILDSAPAVPRMSFPPTEEMIAAGTDYLDRNIALGRPTKIMAAELFERMVAAWRPDEAPGR